MHNKLDLINIWQGKVILTKLQRKLGPEKLLVLYHVQFDCDCGWIPDSMVLILSSSKLFKRNITRLEYYPESKHSAVQLQSFVDPLLAVRICVLGHALPSYSWYKLALHHTGSL